MKKTLSVLLFTMFVSFGVEAQQFHSISFLSANISSLNVSNKLGITNLLSTALGVTTNAPGIVWTNSANVSNNVASADTTQFLQDIPLWSDRNGQIPCVLVATNTGVYDSGYLSGANLTISIALGGSGANSAVNFVFVPVMDGAHESTTSGDAWTVGVTASTTSRVTISTNAPLYKWPGCKALRLKTITNTDTDASSQVTLDTIVLNGFVP